MRETNQLIEFIRDIFHTHDFIPLHEPSFSGHEKAYVLDTIESTFVSSVGAYVGQFEEQLSTYTGSDFTIATMNGTAALHTALLLAGVRQNDIVITQALTFVATCNAIHYCGAEPAFVDVARESLGMCPEALSQFLEEYAILDDHGDCLLKETRQKISACLPMHTFGHPVDLDELESVCQRWHLPLVEDAAESLGSLYKGQHTGTRGLVGVLSFNGNKIMTTGGGGAVLTQREELFNQGKHLTTTAKVPHPFEYVHDQVGYNYRLPNLNAALGVAQLEQLDEFIIKKRHLASAYAAFCESEGIEFLQEPHYARSNYWLNAMICSSIDERNQVLEVTNQQGVMTRPIWKLACDLQPYSQALRGDLSMSRWLELRVVNLPSSATAYE